MFDSVLIFMERSFKSAVHYAAQFQANNSGLFDKDIVDVGISTSKLTDDPFDIDFVATLDFKNAVEKHSGITLKYYEVDDDIPPPHAYYTRDSSNVGHVIFSKFQSWCMKRMGVCKELCHVLTDDDTVKAGLPTKQLEFAVERPGFDQISDKLSSEMFCYFLAVELMIPPHLRPEIQKKKSNCSHYEIATMLRVPEVVIRNMFEMKHWDISNLIRGRN